MLHALGFHHEHNRPDRATFLDVDLDATDADAQFQLMGTSEWVRALTDTRTGKLSTGENVQKWTRFSLLFFPTVPSDEYDSAPSRNYLRPLLDVSACIS